MTTTTETERLLLQAHAITERIHGSAPDGLVLAVFERLCIEADAAFYEVQEGAALH